MSQDNANNHKFEEKILRYGRKRIRKIILEQHVLPIPLLIHF